jgi:hypothetical protein
MGAGASTTTTEKFGVALSEETQNGPGDTLIRCRTHAAKAELLQLVATAAPSSAKVQRQTSALLLLLLHRQKLQETLKQRCSKGEDQG